MGESQGDYASLARTIALGCAPALRDRIERRLDSATRQPERAARYGEECARLLLASGLPADAERLFEALRRQFPQDPAGYVGLARVAMERHAWQEALECWAEVRARFGDRGNYHWELARCETLMSLGWLAEAGKAYAELTRRFAAEPAGWAGLARLAMRAQDFPAARVHWDQAVARCGHDAPLKWLCARATTLAELDLLDEADAVFQELTTRAPTEPDGFVGLARSAMRRQEWRTALDRWDEILRRFATRAEPAWRLSTANVLLQLGLAQESAMLAGDAVHAEPENVGAQCVLARSLLLLGRRAQALQALAGSGARSTSVPAVIEARFQVLIQLQRLGDARREYQELLQQALDPGLLASLLEVTPRLFEGWQRTQCWLSLRERVKLAGAQLSPQRSAALDVLRMRLLLALRDYAPFLDEVDEVVRALNGGHHRDLLRAAAAGLRTPAGEQRALPKIFAIGLSKTGTTSLAAALRTLGFTTLDWVNPLTCELFCEDDLPLFDAFTDSPVCTSAEYLYYLYPAARFIYTVRPIPEWDHSICDHFRRLYGCGDFREIARLMEQPDTFHYGARYANISRSLYFRHESFAAAFRAHDRRVRQFFRDKPAHRFMELDLSAGHGWRELCEFLGSAVPATPFPWSNRRPWSRGSSAAVPSPPG